jgi:hypothetical protein
MRSILKAYNITDRVVWSCDTFTSPTPPGNWLIHNIIVFMVWLLASIPSLWWRRTLLKFVMKVNPEFPADDNPDDDEMNALVFIMKNAYLMKTRPGVMKGLQSVQSNFARYGLLDDQIQFLQVRLICAPPPSPFSFFFHSNENQPFLLFFFPRDGLIKPYRRHLSVRCLY